MNQIILCLFLLASTLGHAQNAVLKGKLFWSESKIPLDSVSVKIVTSDSTLIFETFSNSDGSYILSKVPESEYSVEFSKKGFETKITNGLRIRTNKIHFLDAVLDKIKPRKKRRRKRH